ncbi:MAG: hypothetical protein WC197_08910 [Candidatus Gastranaerophilaceae bacterium]|jgi:hypothetical protein
MNIINAINTKPLSLNFKHNKQKVIFFISEPDSFLLSNKNVKSSNINFCGKTTLDTSINNIFEKFNKPVVPKEKIEAWLGQFEEADRKTAALLLENIDFKTYPDCFEESKQLHQKLVLKLKQDGFDTKFFENVDFSKPYTAKSGDITSYMYRKANKIRSVNFKTTDALKFDPQNSHKDRALVILDDYMATGVQFLFEFLARKQENIDLFDGYKKVYVLANTANDKAIEKFDLLQLNHPDKVADIIWGEYPEIALNSSKEKAVEDLAKMSDKKMEFMYQNREIPLLSPENKKLSAEQKIELRAFLDKYNVYKYPFGVGNNQGHTSFFYSAPNTLPDILWNPKISKKECSQSSSKWFPLLQRTEDISVYQCADSVPKQFHVF